VPHFTWEVEGESVTHEKTPVDRVIPLIHGPWVMFGGWAASIPVNETRLAAMRKNGADLTIITLRSVAISQATQYRTAYHIDALRLEGLVVGLAEREATILWDAHYFYKPSNAVLWQPTSADIPLLANLQTASSEMKCGVYSIDLASACAYKLKFKAASPKAGPPR
jgi:hypothetical protein